MDPTLGLDSTGTGGRPVLEGPRITIRPLSGLEDFRHTVGLQVVVWGDRYSDVVPASLLKVVGEVGGLSLGAFSGGTMVGFVFGLTGPREGQIAHWSHMLAVLPSWRDQGVGRALKEEQARVLRERGVRSMLWTFDPLVARNAHLNLTRLGVDIVRYAPDMYGNTGSEVHSFGTDRLVACWSLARPDTPRTPSAELLMAPVLEPLDPSPKGGGMIRIEIPWDIEAINTEDADEAQAWRARNRAAFSTALQLGFEVVGFHRPESPGPCHYLLRRTGTAR